MRRERDAAERSVAASGFGCLSGRSGALPRTCLSFLLWVCSRQPPPSTLSISRNGLATNYHHLQHIVRDPHGANDLHARSCDHHVRHSRPYYVCTLRTYCYYRLRTLRSHHHVLDAHYDLHGAHNHLRSTRACHHYLRSATRNVPHSRYHYHGYQPWILLISSCNSRLVWGSVPLFIPPLGGFFSRHRGLDWSL